MDQINKEKGSITVEATLSVTMFMLLMLFLSSLFFITSAQEDIAHAVIQTTQSLSLEAYSINKMQTNINTGAKAALTDLAVKIFSTSNSDPHFYEERRWFDENQLVAGYVTDSNNSTYDNRVRNIDLADVIKQRFIGYFANGSENAADAYLKSLGVVDGIDGIDFTESTVESGNLNVTAKYQIQYKINLGKISTINMTQIFSAKIWN